MPFVYGSDRNHATAKPARKPSREQRERERAKRERESKERERNMKIGSATNLGMHS
jgi:hypothetical protein